MIQRKCMTHQLKHTIEELVDNCHCAHQTDISKLAGMTADQKEDVLLSTHCEIDATQKYLDTLREKLKHIESEEVE